MDFFWSLPIIGLYSRLKMINTIYDEEHSIYSHVVLVCNIRGLQ